MSAAYWDYARDTDRGGGFSWDVTQFLYGKLFNLFVDPKARLMPPASNAVVVSTAYQQEEHSDLIRNTDLVLPMEMAVKAHLATFKAFPPPTVSMDDVGAGD